MMRLAFKIWKLGNKLSRTEAWGWFGFQVVFFYVDCSVIIFWCFLSARNIFTLKFLQVIHMSTVEFLTELYCWVTLTKNIRFRPQARSCASPRVHSQRLPQTEPWPRSELLFSFHYCHRSRFYCSLLIHLINCSPLQLCVYT